MARILSQPVRGLAKQLLSATASLHSPESLQLPLVAAHVLRVPFQQCLLHSPAYGAHSYHGSRDDDDSTNSKASTSAAQTASEDDPSSESNNSAGSNSRASSSSSSGGSKVTEQLKALQESIEQVQEYVQAGQQAREAAQLPEHVARHAMRDPLGMLMTSRGVPLGISLKVNPETFFKQRQQQQSQREAEADRQDWQELLGNNSSSSSMQASDDHHTSVPSTDAQLLRVKLIKAAKKLVSASKTSSKRSIGTPSPETASNSNSSSSTGASSTKECSTGASSTSDSTSSGKQGAALPRQTTVGQQAKEQLAHLLASADADSWGTTQQSPAEIARQIAESNRAASGGGDGSDGDGEGDDDGEEGGDDEPLTLSAVEERYADQEAVTAELKEMDEIYEVLAKVPWLDDKDVDERELRGVVAVGLLGTLEEVGWQLREKLLCLWAGERDLDVLTEGVGPREAAALTAILYHTEQLEREFDKPPAAGVAAALAAAGGDPVQARSIAAAGDGAESGGEAKN